MATISDRGVPYWWMATISDSGVPHWWMAKTSDQLRSKSLMNEDEWRKLYSTLYSGYKDVNDLFGLNSSYCEEKLSFFNLISAEDMQNIDQFINTIS